MCVCVFEHVHISVGLVTFSNHSLSYHLGMYSEDSKFFDTSRIWIFDSILISISFGSTYHARIFIHRQKFPSLNVV